MAGETGEITCGSIELGSIMLGKPTAESEWDTCEGAMALLKRRNGASYSLQIWMCSLALLASSFPAGADLFVKNQKRIRLGPNVTSLLGSDLNGDGHPEIVTTERGQLSDPNRESPAQDQISFFVAEGPLEYLSQPQLSSGFGSYQVVVANIDALKAPDLIVGSFLATKNRDVTLLRNLGKNRFEPSHFAVDDGDLRYTKTRDGDNNPIFTTPGITSLAVHDFNGDGFRDVLATGWSSDVLILFPGMEEVYFGEPVLTRAHGGPRDLSVVDLDGDGHSDLAITMYSSNEVTLWRGNGDGTFVELDRFSSRGKLPHKILAADFDKDGELDVALSHRHADDSVVIFYGAGNFAFHDSLEMTLGNNRGLVEYEIQDLIAGDFDQDGDVDLAAACYAANQVVVFVNQGNHFRSSQLFRKETYIFKKGKPRALCASDFNGDGKIDLGVVLWEADTIAFLLGK